MDRVRDGARLYAQTCARTIAATEVDHEATMVCVVIAHPGSGHVIELDASAAMYGRAPDAPPALLELARRLMPAIEALVREMADERGEIFVRRTDLEVELDMRDIAERHDDEGAPS